MPFHLTHVTPRLSLTNCGQWTPLRLASVQALWSAYHHPLNMSTAQFLAFDLSLSLSNVENISRLLAVKLSEINSIVCCFVNDFTGSTSELTTFIRVREIFVRFARALFVANISRCEPDVICFWNIFYLILSNRHRDRKN